MVKERPPEEFEGCAVIVKMPIVDEVEEHSEPTVFYEISCVFAFKVVCKGLEAGVGQLFNLVEPQMLAP